MRELWEHIASSPSSIWQIGYLDLTVRMLLAVILGGIIGLEREWSNHAAGLRTHIMVTIGAAAIMMLSIYGFSEFVDEPNVRVDPARLAAQVISGIGFLGAGAILRNGLSISGLTTAASIWVTAAIGLGVGAGFYYGSILCTILVFVVLQTLNRLEKRIKRPRTERQITLQISNRPELLGRLVSLLGERGLEVSAMSVSVVGLTDHPQREADSASVSAVKLRVRSGSEEAFLSAVGDMHHIEGVMALETGRLTASRPMEKKIAMH